VLRRLKTYQIVTDVVAAAVFFVIAWPVESVMSARTGIPYRFEFTAPVVVAAIVVAVFATALAVRRLSPALALGIAWAGALLQMGLGRPPGIADVAIFAVLYATAAYGSQRVYWAGLASSLVGALVITVYLMAGPIFANGPPTWDEIPSALLLLVAAAFALGLSWTVGALVRAARRAAQNREAQEHAEAEAVVEQERVRIARDMHDVVAHSLAVVIAQADGARYAAASDPQAATTALATISETSRAALSDVRQLLTQLRHSQPQGPQPTLADLEELYAQVRAAGVELRLDVDGGPSRSAPAAVQLAVYRILQEALTTALRHGDGGPVSVRIAWLPTAVRGAPGVQLEVHNRLRPGDRPSESGHGLIGMGERASLVGGWLKAADEDGEFVVRAALPIGQIA
jgi:signal transduction histidine kinase